MVYFEIKQRSKNIALMSEFISDIKDNKALEDEQKVKKLVDLLTLNGYRVTKATDEKVKAFRKDLSIGMMLLGFGMFGVGLFFYFLYYYFIQKPKMLEVYI